MKCNLISSKSIPHKKSLAECPESDLVSDKLTKVNLLDEDVLQGSDADMFWIGNDVAIKDDGSAKNQRTGKEPEGNECEARLFCY